MPPTLYLIDGHALAYRTYFAILKGGQHLMTTKGEITTGIYGFCSVLLRLLDQEQPEFLAVAFDTGRTFRNDLFADYKATRAKMPDELRPQIDRLHEMVEAFGLPILEKEGYEADDVLGSVTQQAVASGLGVKIITGDRDLLQLVNDRVIVNLAGNKLSEAKDYGPQDVVALLGIYPWQIVDYKALVGDTSDNIPGVHGIGEKTAVELLKQFPTLDDIYANLDKLPPRIRTLLEKGREAAYLSRDLARIRTDVPITLDLERARTRNLDFAAVEQFFQELEFRSLIPRLKALQQKTPPATAQLSLFGLPLTQIGTPAAPETRYHIVDTPSALDALCARLEQATEIAFDTETTHLDPLRAELVGISLAMEPGEGYYIPLGHLGGEHQLPWELVRERLRPYLEHPHKPKVGHNMKYDVLVLAEHGLWVSPLRFDTMIAAWLLNPEGYNFNLKGLAESYLGIQMTHIEELIGKGKKQRSMAEVPVEMAAPYAAADAEICLRLKPLLESRLKEVNALHLFEDIEMPLVPVLARMEQAGIALDVPFLRQMSRELQQRMAEIETQIFDIVGYPFNLNSTQQLSRALFETLRLEPPDRRKRTSSGHYSTSAEVLEEMRSAHPIIEMILEYRELAKLKSTYVDALPEQVNPKTGRVHTSFNQTGSVTGRLASSDPNLQNIPARTETGRLVRRAFIAAPGKVLISVDYSQIELRIVAHISGDEAMINAFLAGQDIHAATAAAIYGVPLDQVTKEQRRHAKAINFGLIYGMSPYGLTRTTDLTLAEAENFVQAYFRQFPRVKDYIENTRALAARQGYVETLLGRRRYFPNLKNPPNPAVRQREEREAINAPIQGTAADIMKIAMVRLPAALEDAGLSARLLLQVHDELVLECPAEEKESTARVVKNVMENAYTLVVPLLTEARWGLNWGEMEPFENIS
ncbi:DNA polymerase I [Thermanaerothrix sp.]|jgi:DNA polymerase-1|uniref:DNA polymerase I n=1 Tax=Thermanaerothrix sp. TaxID=2972675 RepID=UPI002ADE651C|nr:DNA polymerase I [Thermanaerothrix sp.]